MRNGLMALLANNRGRGFFRAEAAGDTGEATLYLYDVIVSDDYWGGVSALTIAKELAALRDASTIHLRLNSPGGDVFAGRAMEQAIREHPANIIAHVDGFAASAASYVAMAANEVAISPGGMFMIHKAWTIGWGNSDDLIKTAALLEQIDESLVKTYADATGQDPDQLRQWMAAETWMTADESVERGFADRIAGDSTTDASAMADSWDMSAYAAAPEPQPKHKPDRRQQADPVNRSIDAAHYLRRLATTQI